MKSLVSSLVLIGLTLHVASDARAQTEITLLSPNPIEAVINKLAADFEAKTGTHVKITYGSGVSTRKTPPKSFSIHILDPPENVQNLIS